MAECIERGAALEIAMQYCPDDDGSCSKAGLNLREMLDEIEAIPAADVVPVRHSKWIEQPHDFNLCGVAYYQCSECGKEQQTPSNYCPFCGALMDKDGDRECMRNR